MTSNCRRQRRFLQQTHAQYSTCSDCITTATYSITIIQSPVLKQLYLLPVRRRGKYKLVVLVFTPLRGQTLPYLAEECQLIVQDAGHRRWPMKYDIRGVLYHISLALTSMFCQRQLLHRPPVQYSLGRQKFLCRRTTSVDGWLVEQGLTLHRTHYIGHIGDSHESGTVYPTLCDCATSWHGLWTVQITTEDILFVWEYGTLVTSISVTISYFCTRGTGCKERER